MAGNLTQMAAEPAEERSPPCSVLESCVALRTLRPSAFLCFITTLLIAAAAPARADDFNLATLFAALAKERPARATFHEKKHIALLDRPLESSGELVFTPPDRLEKRTLAPRPERVVADRERVTLERGGRSQTLGLREHPAIAVLVDSIRDTLAGDLQSLTRAYSAALEGDRARWKLRLRPLDPAIATLVERIEIGGAGARVRTVDIFQADGDRSSMTIAAAER